MRYLVALLASGLLIIGMLAFTTVMEGKLEEALTQGADLSFLDRVLFSLAQYIAVWGWLIALVIILLSLGIARVVKA